MKNTGIQKPLRLIVCFVAAIVGLTNAIQVEDGEDCCTFETAECNACRLGISEEDFCIMYEQCSATDDVFCQDWPNEKVCIKDCCEAISVECEACRLDISEEEFCFIYDRCQVTGQYVCLHWPYL